MRVPTVPDAILTEDTSMNKEEATDEASKVWRPVVEVESVGVGGMWHSLQLQPVILQFQDWGSGRSSN